jgi:hypothetical protein
MRWAGHDVNKELSTKIMLENPKGNDRLGDPGAKRLMILALEDMVAAVYVTVQRYSYPVEAHSFVRSRGSHIF